MNAIQLTGQSEASVLG